MKYKKPSVTVDIIVEIGNKIPLVRRKHEPYKGMWAIPGGFLEVGKENLKKTVRRELYEETSLRAYLKNIEVIGESSDPDRDPRGHIVTVIYRVTDCKGEPKAGDDAQDIKLFPRYRLPSKLAFDHKKTLNEYIKKYGKWNHEEF